MKRLILLFLCLAILVSGCGLSNFDTQTSSTQKNNENESSSSQSNSDSLILNDYNYLEYLETSVYAEALNIAGSEENIINVEAIYYSKEYLEECEYNSKENIYFGYTLSELNAQFVGERYYFTFDEDGKTTVEVFETQNGEIDEDFKNIARLSGMVLITLTVVIASGALKGQAVKVVLNFAKNQIIPALKSGALEGIIKGILVAVQSGNLKEGLKEGILEGYEGFAWGAIVGTLIPSKMSYQEIDGYNF